MQRKKAGLSHTGEVWTLVPFSTIRLWEKNTFFVNVDLCPMLAVCEILANY